jgi:hypothetical protein
VREHGTEIAAITGQPDSNMDWQKLVSEYLWLRTMPDDEIETQRLPCWAKGYLIYDNELYHHSISGILQWCIPVEEGKALLLVIHEGICGHHASSRSMIRKAFQ